MLLSHIDVSLSLPSFLKSIKSMSWVKIKKKQKEKLIHFKRIFVFGVRYSVPLHSFACGSVVVLALLVEKTFFSSLNYVSILVEKLFYPRHIVYFWALHSITLMYILLCN